MALSGAANPSPVIIHIAEPTPFSASVRVVFYRPSRWLLGAIVLNAPGRSHFRLLYRIALVLADWCASVSWCAGSTINIVARTSDEQRDQEHLRRA
jgi:hypothetical protein